jgi:NADPH:quinone reductase-like Zn-dependent oxidoreductase
MKAWVCRAYGDPDVLTLEDRPAPQPKGIEVLVRICATTVSAGDMRVRSLKLPRGFGLLGRLALGFTGPRQPVLGTEFSGIVAAVGQDVTDFKSLAFPAARWGAMQNTERCLYRNQ